MENFAACILRNTSLIILFWIFKASIDMHRNLINVSLLKCIVLITSKGSNLKFYVCISFQIAFYLWNVYTFPPCFKDKDNPYVSVPAVVLMSKFQLLLSCPVQLLLARWCQVMPWKKETFLYSIHFFLGYILVIFVCFDFPWASSPLKTRCHWCLYANQPATLAAFSI